MAFDLSAWAEAHLADFVVFDASGCVVETTRRHLAHVEIGDDLFERLPVLRGLEGLIHGEPLEGNRLTYQAVRLPAPHDANLYDFHVSRHPTQPLGLLIAIINSSFVGEAGDALRSRRSERVMADLIAAERAKFQDIYRQTPVAIFALDAGGVATALSNSLRDWLGADVAPLKWIEWFRMGYEDQWRTRLSPTGRRTQLRCGASIAGANLAIVDVDVFLVGDDEQGVETFVALHDVTYETGLAAALRRQTTDLERAGNALRDSNRRLEQFAHVAAHDLVGPLGRMATYADLLELERTGSPDNFTASAIKAIQVSARESVELVRELLALARLETASTQLEPVNVGRLAADLVQGMFLTQPLTIRHDNTVIIQADLRLVRLIARNLISNSYKYRRDGIPITVTVSLERDGGGASLLLFTDNGSGFDDKGVDPFIAFARMREHEAIEGTGLGLAMVKDAATAMGWEAGISAQRGTGTVVSFRGIHRVD